MNTAVSERYQMLRRNARQRLAERDNGARVRIQIGSATCENAAGAGSVRDEFEKHLRVSKRSDIQLHRVACTGRCSREPIVTVLEKGKLPIKYERVDREKAHRIFTEHILHGEVQRELMLDAGEGGGVERAFVLCAGARCARGRAAELRALLRRAFESQGIDAALLEEGSCFGLCTEAEEADSCFLLVRPERRLYRIRSEEDIQRIAEEASAGRGALPAELLVDAPAVSAGFFELYGDLAFFNRQSRIALRNSGMLDPESLDEYLEHGGFASLSRCLGELSSEQVIAHIQRSRLRGRGGGGYPTARKWADAARRDGAQKYFICNADEGDPGAFMDRSMLEGDPFSVLEGLLIGAYAVGAQRCFVYVRAEYPLAIERLRTAIAQMHAAGLLGKSILESSFDCEVELRLGAGAFVCGEETALIHSIEGRRGQPRVRPPYPTASGLWGKPTVINNVETLANVPVIFQYGAEWFARLGSEQSGGTKVFALAGKVRHTGLVEVPMGTSLREVVVDIGGGVPGGKRLKAVQTGGPAGGCIPASYLDTAVDFDSLAAVGSIMGSGGMIVLDEDDCMIDLARYFLTFSQDESCGKCTPCREGSKRMLELIEKIIAGKGVEEDLEKLHRLAVLVQKASLCGLGRAAPNPVLSMLQYFREECEAHVREHRCPALRCKALIRYEVIAERCVGCTACARHCPVDCIDGKAKKVHVIDQQRCIRCGRCVEVCRFAAIARS